MGRSNVSKSTTSEYGDSYIAQGTGLREYLAALNCGFDVRKNKSGHYCFFLVGNDNKEVGRTAVSSKLGEVTVESIKRDADQLQIAECWNQQTYDSLLAQYNEALNKLTASGFAAEAAAEALAGQGWSIDVIINKSWVPTLCRKGEGGTPLTCNRL